MADTSDGQLIEVAGPIFERHLAGQDVVLLCHGLPAMSFRMGDSVGRDVAIAALLRVGHGLKTDTIGQLCGASHGWVCEVRRRLSEGGLERVVARAPLGPARQVVGAKEVRLRDLHADGVSIREIAKALGFPKSVIGDAIKRLGLPRRGWRMKQQALPVASTTAQSVAREAVAPSAAPIPEPAATQADVEVPAPTPALDAEASVTPPSTIDTVEMAVAAIDVADTETAPSPAAEELVAGAPRASGPAEHPCRYAGTLLICAAATALGVFSAIDAAHAARPVEAVYDAHQVVSALMAAWGAGYGSLEAMHERDARALGVILGLERSPSVRTMHRAIKQMGMGADAIELNAALMRGLLAARSPESLWFGLDGHFKAYAGMEPIDKGWDSKRRLAVKGIADVIVNDAHGFTWSTRPVAAGSGLAQHLGELAVTLRGVLGNERPIVVTFDRGGFDFDALEALGRDGFYYAGYVPATVTLPDLGTIAPTGDGVGEITWSRARLHHPARLIVERDGAALIPMVTNLPTLVDTATVVEQLRAHRGAQENSFKAARSFAHIDRLVDRGGASRAPDDRPVPNPARAAIKQEQQRVAARIATLADETPATRGRSRNDIYADRFWAEVNRVHLERELRAAPAKVPRVTIEPDAQRAQLKTRHRMLLQPLKFATDNARRWLLATLGDALAPSDEPYDQETSARTLLALLRAPGTVRFDDDLVTVTVELPLPPTAHARLGAALDALDARGLRFTDGLRSVRFRLAPRPTRATIPGRE
jgi:hypothetical protein